MRLPICELISCIFAFLLGGEAIAEETPLPGPPAQPVLARASAPCETKCEWIVLQGFIGKTTLEGFRRIVKSLGAAKPPVFLNSGGGDVDSALAIGRLVRRAGLDAAVAATVFAAGAPQRGPVPQGSGAAQSADAPKLAATLRQKSQGEALPAPVRAQTTPVRAYCASACTLVLAGGVRRLVGWGVRVGLHEMVIPEQDAEQRVRYYQTRYVKIGNKIVSKETRFVSEVKSTRHLQRQKPQESRYRMVAAFLDEMSVDSKKVVALMRTAAPESIRWLPASDVKETRLATETSYADSLLGLTAAPRVVAKGASGAPSSPHALEPKSEPGSGTTPLPALNAESPWSNAVQYFGAVAGSLAIMFLATRPRRRKTSGAP
jgi:hypothetical protein